MKVTEAGDGKKWLKRAGGERSRVEDLAFAPANKATASPVNCEKKIPSACQGSGLSSRPAVSSRRLLQVVVDQSVSLTYSWNLEISVRGRTNA